MTDAPIDPEELDDPADYEDESEPDTGDLPLADDLLPPLPDYGDIVFEEGEDAREDADPQLGVTPGGIPGETIAGPLVPVSTWVEVDEGGTFEDLVPADVEPVDEPEDDVTTLLVIDEEDENEPEDLGPEWAKYEVWGRDRDEPVEWQLLSTQDYGQDAQAEIENLRTGTRMEFKVRLLSTDNVASEWSEVFFYTLPSDLTPPPAPTPPTAENNNGFITHSHDGTLTDDVPPDMSHRVLYAQQMEPTVGDPMRITEWRGVGAETITTGRYLDRTLHRAWLIAVDTTGNESDRSDYVEFTPTQPVDGQRIRDELAELDGRVGEGFDESLTEAIAGADQRIDSLAVGELFVENAIKAPSIDVQDLAANVARMNQLWVGFAGISEAQIDSLLANNAKVKVITSALSQSHEDERGWKHLPDGRSIWYNMHNPGEAQTAVRDDGTLYAQGAYFEGDVSARSVDLKGGLRVGNGEGGITPAGSRIRIEGRLPTNDGSRDLILQGAVESSSELNHWGRAMHTMTYSSPSPTGTRRVIAGVNTNVALSNANMTVNPQTRTASGFTATVQMNRFESGYRVEYWVQYIAVWV